MPEPEQAHQARGGVDSEDLYRKGWTAAAAMEPVERYQVYRQWYREATDAFSVGFRDCTLRTMD